MVRARTQVTTLRGGGCDGDAPGRTSTAAGTRAVAESPQLRASARTPWCEGDRYVVRATRGERTYAFQLTGRCPYRSQIPGRGARGIRRLDRGSAARPWLRHRQPAGRRSFEARRRCRGASGRREPHCCSVSPCRTWRRCGVSRPYWASRCARCSSAPAGCRRTTCRSSRAASPVPGAAHAELSPEEAARRMGVPPELRELFAKVARQFLPEGA